MPIDPISSPGAPAPRSTGATPADQLGTDTFLQLMVAQLRYQNPLAPTDGTEFLAQTAQFTMVERLNQLASQSTDLLASNRSLTAAALIGQTVSWAGDDGAIERATVTGARFGSAGPTLLLDGGQTVPLDQVREVGDT